MARVLLLKPNKTRGRLIEHTQPLGLMYIASCLRNGPKPHEVRIVDLLVERKQFADVAEEARAFDPDVIGISCLSPEASAMHRLAADVKGAFPGRPVVVGGPHASASWHTVMLDPSVDVAVLGEAEDTAVELVDALAGAGPLTDVRGIACRRGGGTELTGARPFVDDLDRIPFPAWDLIPIEKYFKRSVISESKIRSEKRYMSIFSSRACPYKCIYCHNIFGKKFRTRSAANVLAEISTVVERYGIREFHFLDDTFNLNVKRLREICDTLAKDGPKIKISFPNGLRGDILTEDLLDRLRAAGTYHISFGIETGSERIQKLIKKSANLPKIQKMIDYADSLGIYCHGFFMLGFPTETADDVEETIRFAERSRLHTAGFHQVLPFPNTALHDLAREHHPELRINTDSYDFTVPDINVSAMSDDVLKRKLREAVRKFYFRPSRLRRLFAVAPRKLDIFVTSIYYVVFDRRLSNLKRVLERVASQKKASPVGQVKAEDRA